MISSGKRATKPGTVTPGREHRMGWLERLLRACGILSEPCRMSTRKKRIRKVCLEEEMVSMIERGDEWRKCIWVKGEQLGEAE